MSEYTVTIPVLESPHHVTTTVTAATPEKAILEGDTQTLEAGYTVDFTRCADVELALYHPHGRVPMRSDGEWAK